ncbi:MAG: hypothetical protein EA358_10605 [Flavobacteriales bacterium]|nr:MAG: hypothetical protein EA358_10605 [Flavobacteriales bacterium]
MKNYQLVILLAFVLLAPVFVYAQPRPPSVPVPLDGGIVALLAAGAMYGAKKYNVTNKKQN